MMTKDKAKKWHLDEVSKVKLRDYMEVPELNLFKMNGDQSPEAPDLNVVYESTANGTGNCFHEEWLKVSKSEGDPDKSQDEEMNSPREKTYGILDVSEAEEAAKAGTPPYKISQGLADLRMIRTRSMNELKGLFTPAEWMYMADSLNGTMVTTDFRCLPMALVASIEDSDTYDSLGSKWEVDVKALCDKIAKLTAAQVDAVFTRAEAFWDSEEKDLEEWSKW